MFKLIKLFVFLIFVTFTKQLSCQIKEKIEPKTPYVHFTTLNGLPSNETYTTIQDHQGYIWITTDKGVSRYNGYEFENFTTSDGLIDNTIFKIILDSQNRIWFIGYNKKLCYFENNTFHEYKYNDLLLKINTNTSKNNIHDFDIDKENNIFLGFNGTGYIILNEDGEIIQSRLNSLFYDQNGEIIIISGNVVGKIFFNNSYKEYLFTNSDKENENNHLYLTVNDTIMKEFNETEFNFLNEAKKIKNNRPNIKEYATFIKTDDVLYFHLYNLTYSENINFPQIQGNQLYKIFKINDNYIRVDHQSIWLLDTNLEDDKLILNLNHLDLVNNYITSLNEINGNLWITTFQNGVIHVPNYKNPSTLNYKIKDKPISAIIQKNDSLFLKPESTEYSYYLDSNFILNLHNKNIYFNPETEYSNSFYGYIYNFYSDEKNIKCITNNGTVYLANRKYIFIINDNNKLEKISNANSTIFSIVNYRDTLLVGTQSGIKYLAQDKKLKNYNVNGVNYEGYRIQDLKAVNDILIIATRGNGLTITNPAKTTTFNYNNGLASNIINHLFLENDNKLWVATNKGANLIMFNKNNKPKIRKLLNTNQGILSPDIRQIYVKDSIAYLACDLGLSILNLNKLKQNENTIPVYFKEIIFNDDSYLKNELNDTTLAYNQNSILFRFTGISTDYLNDITYRYKLEGIEDDWVYSKDRYIRYNSLKPGKYTFIVQAQNANNVWSKVHPKVNITITQPFWKNPVFITFIIFCFIVFSYITIAYYFISERNQNKLQKELNRVKQESLNAQMNPHFIYNSLNSIQSYILKNDKKLANKYLVKFANLMRLTFENSQNHYVNLEEELKALVLYLELEQMRFDTPFSYEIKIDDKINQNECTVPTLLIQPFVENAIWHGINHENIKQGHIEISIKTENDKLIISIKDNGIGIFCNQEKKLKNSDNNHHSRGILITKKRLDLVNELENKNYLCDIINLRDKNGNSIGTLVKFTIPHISNLNDEN